MAPDDHDSHHVQVAVELVWVVLGAVVLVDDKLQLPKAPSQAAVYRFSLHTTEGDSVYIGEGVLLNKRFDWYRIGHQSQATNHRMNKRMKAVLAHGGVVQVDMATEIRLEVDGQPVPSDLSNAFQRKLAENAALLASQQTGVKIENLSKES